MHAQVVYALLCPKKLRSPIQFKDESTRYPPIKNESTRFLPSFSFVIVFPKKDALYLYEYYTNSIKPWARISLSTGARISHTTS
jgi:hypothetical protein